MNPNIHTVISEFGIPSEQPCVIKTLLATRLMRWDAYASITGYYTKLRSTMANKKRFAGEPEGVDEWET